MTAVVVAATGCGSLDPEIETGERRPAAAAPEPCRPVDRQVFTINGMYDFTPAESLADLLSQHRRHGGPAPTVVSGQVRSWSDGPPRHAMMRIAVDEVLVPGDHPDLVRDATAWAPLWRANLVDGAAIYAEGVPPGTRVVALLVPAPPRQQRWAARELPDGPLLGVIAGPQALYLDDCGTLLGGLDALLPPGHEFRDLDTLAAAVRDLQPS